MTSILHTMALGLVLAGHGAAETPAAATPPLATAPAGALAPGAASASSGAPNATPAAGPAGDWRAARWGMTVDEVLRALPGEAVRLSPEVKLADGNVVAVGIDGHAFEDLKFQVRFIFTAGRLALVSLRTPQDRYADAQAFERLEKALESRWGRPLETNSDRSFVEQRQTRWKVGRSTVDLKFIPGVIVLLYHPAAPGPDGAAATSGPGAAAK